MIQRASNHLSDFNEAGDVSADRTLLDPPPIFEVCGFTSSLSTKNYILGG